MMTNWLSNLVIRTTRPLTGGRRSNRRATTRPQVRRLEDRITPTTYFFSNPAAMTIPAGAPAIENGPASVYPSNIAVAGLPGTVTGVTATITGLTHTFPDDVAFLLAGPNPANNVELMRNAGGGAPGVTGVTYTFADGSPLMANELNPASGTYSPSQFGDAVVYAAPAPDSPYGTTLTGAFAATNPNGTWSLYVFDDSGGDVGSLSGGYSLAITTLTGTTFTYNAATNPAITNYTLRVNAGNFEIVETADPAHVLASQAVLGTTALTITGQNDAADRLIVDFAGGLVVPAGGLVFDGGTGTGTNVLQLQNGSFTSETITPSGPHAGTIQFNGIGAINFSNLAPIDDLVAVTNLTINGTAAGETINIVDGPVIEGTQTTQVNSGASGTFELVNFAKKTNVTINALAGADSITLNITTPAVALVSLFVDGGNDNDTLTGPNQDKTWNITGANSGNIILTLSAFSNVENLTGGSLADRFVFAAGGSVAGTIDGGAGIDELDYSAFTTAVHANLGIGTTNAANLDGSQETPAVTSTATGTATLTYNATTGKFDINMTVIGISPTDPGLRFHIHQAAAGVNGPIIVSLFDAPGGVNLGAITPAGTGFTFTATGIALPLGSEAAYLGDNTYLNVHTTALPGGEIRGQIVRQTQVATAVTLATGAGAVTNLENATGGSGADSLVGSSAVNVLKGNAGNDIMLGGGAGDTFQGGNDNDVMIWANGDGSDIMDGGAGLDTTQVNGSVGAGGDDFLVAPNPADTTRVRFDRLNLGLFNLNIGTTEALTVNGNNGADTFTVNDLAGVLDLITVNTNGGSENDTFKITPSASVTINVDGDQPLPPATPGDTLTLITTGTTNPTLVNTNTTFGNKGAYTFGNRQAVNFQEIETLSPAGTDLSITATDGKTTAIPGDKVTYTVIVTNNGPLAVIGAQVKSSLSPFLTLVTHGATVTGGATTSPSTGTGNIAQTVNMPIGSTITYTVQGTIVSSATGTLVSTFDVTSPANQPDPNPDNNTATDTDTLTPQADLSVTMSDAPDPVAPGGILSYTITVANKGPSDAQSVQLSDTLPAQTTFVSFTGPGGWTITSPPVGGTGAVLATRATLAANSAAQVFTLVVRVDSNTALDTNITNVATVTTATTDSNTGNNSATNTTTVDYVPLPLVVGADGGGGPHVKVYDPVTGALKFSFFAYNAGFLGGVRVAAGDITGDGVADIITGAGPSGGPHVKAFDGNTGAEVRSFFAYSAAFTGGVFVGAGDVNGDGFGDIITGADAGGGPHVIAFSGKDGSVLQSFFAYSAAFHGGVRVAAGDVDGDGRADIVTGAGPGGAPHVEVFSGNGGALLQSFLAYDSIFAGGVYVAAGDLDGNGNADIITGAGRFGGPHVKVFDGPTLAVRASFFAYSSAFLGGVRVAVADIGGNGQLDFVTGAGPGGGPHVKAFNGTTFATEESFFAFDPTFLGGVFVG